MTVESSSSSPRPSWRKEKVRKETDGPSAPSNPGGSSLENSVRDRKTLTPRFLLADSESNDLTTLQALFLFPSPGPKYLTGKVCFCQHWGCLNPYYRCFFLSYTFSPPPYIYLLAYLPEFYATFIIFINK